SSRESLCRVHHDFPDRLAHLPSPPVRYSKPVPKQAFFRLRLSRIAAYSHPMGHRVSDTVERVQFAMKRFFLHSLHLVCFRSSPLSLDLRVRLHQKSILEIGPCSI